MKAATTSPSKKVIGVALVVLTLTAFWGVKDNGFVSYDDETYVLANPHVRGGVSNALWAFTSTAAANWHPLTWLSHMLDWQLFGSNPSGHHLTSLFIHAANVLLLFWLLAFLTGAIWRSALVAALFAVHPVNVESVAWIAERKNVLSTLFWILTMYAYVWYARKPGWRRYLAVFATFLFGLMSKPMLVTLPFALLLLDYWPLRRIFPANPQTISPGIHKQGKRSKNKETAAFDAVTLRQAVIEKLPLLLLCLASSAITIKAQQAGGALGSTDQFPLGVRIENAIVSYAHYLLDLIWPLDLGVFYPHPRTYLPLWRVALSAAVVCALTVLAIRYRNRLKYAPVGWLWYLGTLIPVIGIVQVGLQSRADRYAYIPFIGIFLALVWLISDWAAGRALRVRSASFAAGLVLLGLVIVTRIQINSWQNSATLFERAVAVTDENYLAQNNLGEVLARQGKFDQAARQFEASVNSNPEFAQAHQNLGMILVQQGKTEEAVAEFTRAVSINPRLGDAHNKLGAALASQGRVEEAIESFARALEIDPGLGSARANLGAAYEKLGRSNEAIEAYALALQSIADPAMSAQTHFKLAQLLAKNGRNEEAAQHLRESLRIKPDFSPAQQALRGLMK